MGCLISRDDWLSEDQPMSTGWWQLKPVISRLHYWRRKAHFLLVVDCYQGWVVFAVEEGRFSYEIGPERGEAGFGDLVICPPGTAFRRQVITPMSFHFIEFFWQGPDGRVRVANEAFPTGKISLQDGARLRSSYAHLRALAQQTDALSRHLKDQLLYDLWCLYRSESHPVRNLPALVAEDPLMQRASRYLQQHAYEALSMRALAATLSLSPVQLTRRFRAAYGLTPSTYLTALRMQKVRTLLLETDLTLEEIAQRCGYENCFYLSRVFFKNMQLSPSHFRKRYRVLNPDKTI
jgi:AraC-like DNA-binding protein